MSNPNEFDVFNSSQMIRLVVPRIFFRFIGRFIGRMVVAIFDFSPVVAVSPPLSCTADSSLCSSGARGPCKHLGRKVDSADRIVPKCLNRVYRPPRKSPPPKD